MGRPTTDGPMKLQEFTLDRKYSPMQVWGRAVGNNPLIDERREKKTWFNLSDLDSFLHTVKYNIEQKFKKRMY